MSKKPPAIAEPTQARQRTTLPVVLAESDAVDETLLLAVCEGEAVCIAKHTYS
jgi:hypothetical protein